MYEDAMAMYVQMQQNDDNDDGKNYNADNGKDTSSCDHDSSWQML